MFSDFCLSDKNLSQEFLKKYLPSFFDIYNIYFMRSKPNGEITSINKMIKVEDIITVGYVNHTEDYLNGYNFYIQTGKKLYIMSCKYAKETVRWVESLNRLLAIAPRIIDKCAKQGFRYPIKLINALNKFNPKKFLETNASMFDIKSYKLNEAFDIVAFKRSYKSLKKFLKILKYNEEYNEKIQPFLVEYHQLVCKSLSNTRFEFGTDEMSEVYREMRNYSYLLEKYHVNDLFLKRFLIRFNNVLFDKLIETMLTNLKDTISTYLKSSKSLKFNEDFFECIFESINKNHDRNSKLEIGYDIIFKIISKINNATSQKIILDQDISISQLIAIFKSCLRFNSSFFQFVNKNLDWCLDGKFVDGLRPKTIPQNVNKLLNVSFNEIENRLEVRAQQFFKSKQQFEELNLNDLFNDELREVVSFISEELPSCYAEIIFNNFLNFILICYFSKSFINIGETEFNHELVDKLKKDKKIIYSIFLPLIEKDNLEILIRSFTYLITLLTETKYETLLQSLINFDLFFCNKLTTDIVVAILCKNIDIAIDVEEELVNYFNYCIFITNQKNQIAMENSMDDSKSQIVFNSTKTKKMISNYLPHISMQLSNKLRVIVFNQRARALKKQKDDSIDLSMDMGLVNVSVAENFLENTIKFILFENTSTFKQNMYKEAVEVS